MFANAHGYEQFMGRWSRLLAPRLIEFAGIKDGWRVLDLGSGTGSLSMGIVDRWPHCEIVGIEPSHVYVEYAKSRVHDQAVKFQFGDAQYLPFANADFDASLSLLVFNFIPNPQYTLAELRRVTRPGGPICAVTWDYGQNMRMLRIFWDAAAEFDASALLADEKYLPLCRQGELMKLWREGGLCGVEEQSLEITMQFKSFEDYWEPFLLGQGPAGAFVNQFSPERRIALREQVKRHLPECALHGSFALCGRAWAVRGTSP